MILYFNTFNLVAGSFDRHGFIFSCFFVGFGRTFGLSIYILEVLAVVSLILIVISQGFVLVEGYTSTLISEVNLRPRKSFR